MAFDLQRRSGKDPPFARNAKDGPPSVLVGLVFVFLVNGHERFLALLGMTTIFLEGRLHVMDGARCSLTRVYGQDLYLLTDLRDSALLQAGCKYSPHPSLGMTAIFLEGDCAWWVVAAAETYRLCAGMAVWCREWPAVSPLTGLCRALRILSQRFRAGLHAVPTGLSVFWMGRRRGFVEQDVAGHGVVGRIHERLRAPRSSLTSLRAADGRGR